MNYREMLRVLILGLCTLIGGGSVVVAAYVPPANNRTSFNFNYDWKFIKSNPANAQTVAFNDAAWKTVSVPHSWNDDKFREWCSFINDTPAESSYYGKTWYRKHFTIDAAYSGRKVLLEFEGISRVANFYVNGTAVGIHENGVAPCGVDITNLVNFGADNVIAIMVNNDERYDTIGYGGTEIPYGQPFNNNYGGINRDVTLHIMDKFYQTLPLYRNLGTVGTYIYPTNINTFSKTSNLTVASQVKNESGSSKVATLDAVVVDAAGNAVYTFTAPQQTVANGATATFTATGAMTGVHFWSPAFPYLYKVYTVLKVGGVPVDVQLITTGIRKVIFNRIFGMQINGYPLYLNGYAPRAPMEWPCVGTPVDWLTEYDFKMMRDNNANFVRQMHIAPRKDQVAAADKFGIVTTVPAADNEGDESSAQQWQQVLDIMRDVTIYFRNNPSVLFYEAQNQIVSAAHMQDMVNVRLTWDPYGNRFSGTRSNDGDVTNEVREFSSTMDNSGTQLYNPLWDAEYARGEAPRRVWDNYTPVLNPRWNGVNSDPTPGTSSNTTSKYLIGGYFNVASAYHRGLGLNTDAADAIGDYLTALPGGGHPYFRLNNSEDLVLQNLAKYYGRYRRSAYAQTFDVSDQQGVMVGGAKIIWSDSVTDGRMRDMEVARVSGAVDGARLPKETFYGLQVAHNSQPQVYVIGHWNYAAGTTKRVYVASNTESVKVQLYNSAGTPVGPLLTGTRDFFPTNLYPAGGDQVNRYVFAFDNITWQAGKIKAFGYDINGVEVATHEKSTAGPPAALRITPVVGPSGWRADGNDIAMFDVEVVDSAGKRCPTWEDSVTFSCSGQGVFLGGYNGGKRYTTNFTNATSNYKLNLECGINRVFTRATRTAGGFTLNVTGPGLTSANATVTSSAVTVTNGLSTVWPQKYTFALGAEPPGKVEGEAPPPPPQAPNPAPVADITALHYSGGHNDQAVLVTNVQNGQKVYVDNTATFSGLPSYLVGADFIQPFQSDAGETSSTDQYQFNLVRYSYIYQAIDNANGMPTHNDNASYEWELLPQTITVRGRTMKLYKSRLMAPYENGYFAVNGKNAVPFDPNSNMYLVFVQGVETQLQRPGLVTSASTTSGTNTSSLAIDGSTSTRWNALSGFPQTFDIDLGQQYAMGGYEINWQNASTRAYQYKIDVSDDNVNWDLSVDLQANTRKGINEYRVPSGAAYSHLGRYVKVTITGGPAAAAILEMKVNGVPLDVPTINSQLNMTGAISTAFSYQITATNVPTGFTATGLPAGLALNSATGVISGTPTASGNFNVTLRATNALDQGPAAVMALGISSTPDVNLALNQPTQTSSVQGTTAVGSRAVDSSTTTNWESQYSDPQWIYVDLGAPRTIHSILINWQNAAGKDYKLQVSNNASSWSDIVTVVGNNTSGVTTFSGLNATGRYVRMHGTARKTAYGYNMFDFQVWGQTGTPVQQPPVITSPSSASGTVGSPFSYQITATNSPTSYGLTPGTLPAGLTFSSSTGLISGTPTAQATTNHTMTATNGAGISAGVPLTITINPVSGGDTNIALNKPVAASSFQAGNTPANGNDASITTRWAAVDGTFPQWWRVDLGTAKVLSRADIAWYSSATRSYKYRIETSDDDVGYVTRVDKTGNTTTGDTSDPVAVTARYVRITVTGTSAGFASAYEFQVFGH